MWPCVWNVSCLRLVLALLLMVLPALGGCSNMRHVEWTEDVKLSDGRMIVVQRSEDYRRVVDPGAGFRKGWLFQKSIITAELPAPVQRKVSWEGSLKPLVLDIEEDNTIYLVGVVATGAGRHEWDVPRNELYVVFRLTQGGWEHIPLAELPLSVKPNLLGGTYILFVDREARSGIHVDLELKKELNSLGSPPKRYESIIRLPAPDSKE